METLIVVDMLEDFVSPDGALYVPRAETIVEAVNDLGVYFSTGLHIFVNDCHPLDDPEFNEFPPHAIKGTTGANIYRHMSIGETSHIINKTTFDPFVNHKLLDTLKEHNVDRIYVCGVVTEICIQATVHTALALGYDVVVVKDAIMELDKEKGERALDEMEKDGAKIMLVNDVFNWQDYY